MKSQANSDRLSAMRRNDARSRRHVGWWAFIFHRISGLLLSLFLPLHLLALGQSLRGETALGEFLHWADQPLFKLAVWGLTVLLAVHLIGGIRLLWLEFLPWKGMRRGMILTTAIVSMLFGLALAVTILFS
jgi:fumarate reductase subunit D